MSSFLSVAQVFCLFLALIFYWNDETQGAILLILCAIYFQGINL